MAPVLLRPGLTDGRAGGGRPRGAHIKAGCRSPTTACRVLSWAAAEPLRVTSNFMLGVWSRRAATRPASPGGPAAAAVPPCLAVELQTEPDTRPQGSCGQVDGC